MAENRSPKFEANSNVQRIGGGFNPNPKFSLAKAPRTPRPKLLFGGKRKKLSTAPGMRLQGLRLKDRNIVSLSASGGLASWRFNGFFGSGLTVREMNARLRAKLRFAGVGPAQSGEAGEIHVRGVQDLPPLDGEGGEVGVRGQIPRCAQPLERLAQPGKVSLRRVRDMNMRKIEPGLDAAQHVCDSQRPRHDPPVGGDADEGEEGRPCEPDAFCSGEASIPPQPGSFVYRGVGIKRVNEYVDVGENHVSLPGIPRRLRPPARPRADSACPRRCQV